MPTNVSWYNAANYSLLMEHDNIASSHVLGGIASAFGDASYLAGSSFTVVGSTVITGNPTWTPGAINKVIGSVAPARLAISSNGGAVTSGPNVSPAQTAATRLSIGSSPWGLDSSMTGHIRRVNYWNRALSDTEMQQVTT
jgi:hypothetical protein